VSNCGVPQWIPPKQALLLKEKIEQILLGLGLKFLVGIGYVYPGSTTDPPFVAIHHNESTEIVLVIKALKDAGIDLEIKKCPRF
jgi:hypothetical protein